VCCHCSLQAATKVESLMDHWWSTAPRPGQGPQGWPRSLPPAAAGEEVWRQDDEGGKGSSRRQAAPSARTRGADQLRAPPRTLLSAKGCFNADTATAATCRGAAAMVHAMVQAAQQACWHLRMTDQGSLLVPLCAHLVTADPPARV